MSEINTPSKLALVVNAEETVRNLITYYIESTGINFTIIAVGRGREAFNAIRDHQFDLVVTGNRIDALDCFWGTEFTKTVRKYLPEAKVIFLSSEEIEDPDVKPHLFIRKPLKTSDWDLCVNTIKGWFP